MESPGFELCSGALHARQDSVTLAKRMMPPAFMLGVATQMERVWSPAGGRGEVGAHAIPISIRKQHPGVYVQAT